MRVDRAHATLLAILTLAVSALAVAPVWAGPVAVDAELELERVALFKNGLAFLTYRGQLPENQVLVTLDEIPPPAHGSLWVETPPEVKVRGLFLRQTEASEERAATTLAELLELNLGQRVTLGLSSTAPSRTLSGSLLSASSEIVVLQTEEGLLTLPRQQIEQVHIAGSDARHQRTVTTSEPALQLRLSRSSPGSSFGLTLLTKGLFWSPSYRVDLSNRRTARFGAAALVVNEAVDLEGVMVSLITGFPHLEFAEVVSPMAPDQTLQGFFHAVQNLGRSADEVKIFSQAVRFNTMPQADTFRIAPPTAAGLGVEDLHLTSVGRLRLAQGERVQLPLFDAEVPYEHVYTWDIPDFLGSEASYGNSNDEIPPDEVWHVVRLTNSTDTPWTTAPITFLRDGRLVGQDTLRFTPAGSDARVRINKALGMVVDQVEVETDRDGAPIDLWGRRYRRVTIEGKLTVENGLGKTAKLEITKAFSGELLTVSHTPVHTRRTRGLRSANPTNQLLWELELAAGDQVELRYEHTILVRH